MPGFSTLSDGPSAAVVARWRAAIPPAADRIYLILMLSLIVATPFLVHDQSEGKPLTSLNPLKYLEHQSTAGNPHKQLMLAALYAVCVAVLVLRNRLGRLRYLGIPLGAVMLWTIASTLWSADPSLTLRRCAAITGIALVGAYAGLRFRFSDILRIMAWVTAIVLIASLALAVLAPASGLDYDGRLRGVLDHKNDLGSFAALALLMVTSRLLLFPRHSRLKVLIEWVLAGLSIACLFLAQSASPVAVLAVAMATLVAARLLRNAHPTMLAVTPLLVCASLIGLVFFTFELSEVAPLFGRNADLSGRTLIWRFALQMIWARPLVGYGYGAFWSGANSPGSVFWYLTHVAATHAHDGYLQVSLDVGAVGLLLMVSAIVMTFYRLGWLLRHVREPLVPWAFAHLAFICATNVTESTLWGVGNSLQTVLLVYVIVRTNILAHGARELIARISQSPPSNLRLTAARLPRPAASPPFAGTTTGKLVQ